MSTDSLPQIKSLLNIIHGVVSFVIGTSLIGLFVFLKNVPDERQVRDMINREAPYVREKDAINLMIEHNTEAINKLSLVTSSLETAITALKVEIIDRKK